MKTTTADIIQMIDRLQQEEEFVVYQHLRDAFKNFLKNSFKNFFKNLFKCFFKCFSLAFMMFFIFTLSGCTGNSSVIQDSTKFNIVTSFYPMYIFTLNIAEGVKNVTVTNMTEPQTGDLHDYQLRPGDLRTLEGADVFVINGAGLEVFINKVIGQMPKLKVIEASENISLLIDEDTGESNPHIWVGISGAQEEVENIARGLADTDPGNAAAYLANAKKYIDKLEKLKQDMHAVLNDVKKKNIVTFHKAFPYLAKEFDLNVVAVIAKEPGTEPGAAELADTIKLIRESGAEVLFTEPQYSSKIAKTIAAETGAKIFPLDPVVTGPKDASADYYERIMRENMKILNEALKD